MPSPFTDAMSGNHNDLEKRLWDAADELRANSQLKSSEFSIPVLGLIFLRYADHKFIFGEVHCRSPIRLLTQRALYLQIPANRGCSQQIPALGIESNYSSPSEQ
jgi:HsdM-like protein